MEDPEKLLASEVTGKLIMLLTTGNKENNPDEIVDLLGLERNILRRSTGEAFY